MDTKQLIQQCKQNDYNAQLEMYHSYKNMMFGAAVRIVKSREEAEDIVQDCFIKAFKKIHQLEDSANLGGWLKRIVINKSLDIVREVSKIQWVNEECIEDTETDEEIDENMFSVDFVKKCIQNLKDKYRVVLSLYLIEEYNHREIGELLKINESTVRNQFRRGKQQLLEMIQNQKR